MILSVKIERFNNKMTKQYEIHNILLVQAIIRTGELNILLELLLTNSQNQSKIMWRKVYQIFYKHKIYLKNFIFKDDDDGKLHDIIVGCTT